MAATIDDITIAYEEDGVLLVKELDKDILTRGAWTTILFQFQEYDKAAQDYGPVKFSLRRYKKFKDEYRQQSKFNISNNEQARKIITTLAKWVESSEK